MICDYCAKEKEDVQFRLYCPECRNNNTALCEECDKLIHVGLDES